MSKLKIFSVLYIMAAFSCNTVSNQQPDLEQQRINELKKIDSLIRSADFSLSMAKALDAAYAAGMGQKTGDFLSPGEDTATIRKTIIEEKVATNLSGFYALECGIGLLSERTGKKPMELLSDIVGNKMDSATIELLNRFANATWKAAQPFRDIKRISRETFTVFNFLPAHEIKKDYDQIKAAASKLLFSLQGLANSDIKDQMERLRSLMQNEKYAFEMAAFLDSAYYANNNKPITAFLTPSDTAVIYKSARDQKIATNVAGMYALECGVVYLSTQKNQLPSVVIQSLIDDTMAKEEKMLLARFANATWKSGQPFRGLNRILRETFTPFYFLSEADIEKDIVQVKSAAAVLISAMKK